MKQTNVRLNLILSLTMVIGLAACGSSTLPNELNVTSTAAAVPPPIERAPAVVPLSAYATPSSVQVGGTSLITAQYGSSSTYRYELINTGVGSLTGQTFTAGATSGRATINVSDSAGTIITVYIDITAAPVTQPTAPAAPGTKVLYRKLAADPSTNVHTRIISDSNATPAGYRDEGVAFNVVRDSGVADTVALRECQDSFGSPFVSSDSNCEGQSFLRVLGYVYKSPGAGRRLVKRYSFTYQTAFGNMTDRVSKLDNEPAPGSYVYDANDVYFVPEQSAP